VDTSTFPAVQVRVSVRNRNGVPIPDLTGEHFEIIEDGAAAFEPTSVNTESNPRAQVSLAIVIDTYRTLAGRPIEAAQQATNDLLTELLNEENDADRAAFIGVHRDVSTDPQEINDEFEVPFTNDRNKLLNVINFLHERMDTGAPGTPLYDSVIKAVRLASATEPVGHRAVIAMTDGEDRDSISQDSDTIQTALNERTPVFTIGLSNSRLNEQFLKRLADQTGGTYQKAETPDDFSPLFTNVLEMLRTQYVLAYDSELPQDGQPHSLLVHVRTPTQLEGFQEYRIEAPGGSGSGSEGEGEGGSEGEGTGSGEATEAVPQQDTPEPSPPTPTPETDILTTVRDFVEDNLLLTALVVAAIGLIFLILVVVVIIIIRRRGQVEEEEMVEIPPMPDVGPYAPPPFEAPGPDLGAPTSRAGGPPAPEFPVGGVGPAPARTVAAGTPPVDTRPPSPYGPTAPPPPFAGPAAPPPAEPAAQPPAEPAPAGGTRILKREPKMATVGLLIDRENPTRRFDIAKPNVVIGRTQKCDVVLDHATVSRQHATIKLEEGQFRIYDLGSSNGTFVGENRVREPVALEDGVTVRFGKAEFVFKLVSLDR
jgi:VWFA-related protein